MSRNAYQCFHLCSKRPETLANPGGRNLRHQLEGRLRNLNWSYELQNDRSRVAMFDFCPIFMAKYGKNGCLIENNSHRFSAKPLILMASPRGFEPRLPP